MITGVKKQNVFFVFDAVFFIFYSIGIIVFCIILKLRQLQTQNFLTFRNILSGSRDIQKRKKEKILSSDFLKKILVLKSSKSKTL